MRLFGMHSLVPAAIDSLVLFDPSSLLILLPHLLKQLETVLLLLQPLFPTHDGYFMLVIGEVRGVIVANVFLADKQY